jgi:predicted DNA-binding transcriptional regulator AlpA
MTAATDAKTPPAPGGALPVLIGLREMVALFSVAEFTVYRWNSGKGRPRQLPEPFRVVSGTSMWTEEQVVEFAERKRLTLDPDVLDRIRAEQAHVV